MNHPHTADIHCHIRIRSCSSMELKVWIQLSTMMIVGDVGKRKLGHLHTLDEEGGLTIANSDQYIEGPSTDV